MRKHNGKGPPAHLPDGAEVRVKYRDGQIRTTTVVRFDYGDSGQYDDWTWDGSDCDIIAYADN